MSVGKTSPEGRKGSGFRFGLQSSGFGIWGLLGCRWGKPHLRAGRAQGSGLGSRVQVLGSGVHYGVGGVGWGGEAGAHLGFRVRA